MRCRQLIKLLQFLGCLFYVLVRLIRCSNHSVCLSRCHLCAALCNVAKCCKIYPRCVQKSNSSVVSTILLVPLSTPTSRANPPNGIKLEDIIWLAITAIRRWQLGKTFWDVMGELLIVATFNRLTLRTPYHYIVCTVVTNAFKQPVDSHCVCLLENWFITLAALVPQFVGFCLFVNGFVCRLSCVVAFLLSVILLTRIIPLQVNNFKVTILNWTAISHGERRCSVIRAGVLFFRVAACGLLFAASAVPHRLWASCCLSLLQNSDNSSIAEGLYVLASSKTVFIMYCSNVCYYNVSFDFSYVIIYLRYVSKSRILTTNCYVHVLQFCVMVTVQLRLHSMSRYVLWFKFCL